MTTITKTVSLPIPLPLKLRKNGFTYTQVCRGQRSCIYRQRVAENLDYYEVFLLRVSPEKRLPGNRIIPKKEKFPSDEDFGKYAWSCYSLERARKKFRELEGGKCDCLPMAA